MANIKPTTPKRGVGRPKGSKATKWKTPPTAKAKKIEKEKVTSPTIDEVETKLRSHLETKMNEMLTEFSEETVKMSLFCKNAAQFHLNKVKETTGGIIQEDIDYVLNLGHRIMKHHCEDTKVEIVAKAN